MLKTHLRLLAISICMIIIVLTINPVGIISSGQSVRADSQERIPIFGPQGGSATGPQLAAAMDIPSDLIISASLGSSDIAGAHVFTSSLTGFPTQGGSFGAISSGNAANATRPNSEGSLSTELNGLNNSQGNDLVQLTLVLKVPPGARYWSVDWKFLSEEFPEWVGTEYNDAFLIETPNSSFTISGVSTITAPNNIAFDPSGQLVTINTTGAVGMTSVNASGTTYDGATTKLSSTGQIPPGTNQIRIIFSIMDLGDSIYDTTVFLDNFRFSLQGLGIGQPAQINVPIRWCVLEGSQAASFPSIVTSRTKVANIRTFQSQANLIVDPSIPTNFEFEDFGDGNGNDDGMCESGEKCSPIPPVLKDTILTDNKKGFVIVEQPSEGQSKASEEYNELSNRCMRIWDYEFSRNDKSASSGVFAINIKGYASTDGNILEGLWGTGATAKKAIVPLGGLMVVDYQSIEPADILQTVLAHEIGHGLSLSHTEEKGNLMYTPFISTENNNLTRSFPNLDDMNTQVGIIRERAKMYVGTQLYPLYVDPPIGDSIYAQGGNLTQNEAFVDLTSVGLRMDQTHGVTTLYSVTYGPFPSAVGDLNYWHLLDADGNTTTGASSAETSQELGKTLTAEGIDMIFLVNVHINDGVIILTPLVKKYITSEFQTVNDSSILGFVDQMTFQELAEDSAFESVNADSPQVVVGLQLNSSLIGQLINPHLQGIAENVSSQVVDLSDIKALSFDLPTVPSCLTIPSVIEPGMAVDVFVKNLKPNSIGQVFLGERLITSIATGSNGDVSFSAVIPENAETGYQLVSVDIAETAISASCSIYLTHPPVFDIPPTPLMGTEFEIQSENTINITVQSSDLDTEDNVSLGIVDLPTGATFQPETGNPASATFIWTPSIDQEGVHILTFTSTDDHGSTAQPHSLVITVLPTSNQPPLLIMPDQQIAQYSDAISFDVSAIDPDDANDTLAFSATGLPNNLTLADNGDGTATISGIANVAPGTYNAEITVTDPDGLSDTKPVDIMVTREDARTTYTGPLMVSTGCETCSTAVVPLRATIQDITAVMSDPAYDPDAGNITHATVSFVDRNNGDAVLCSSNVVLLDPSDQKVGTAFCDWTADLGNSSGNDYVVGVVVDGYYTRNSSDEDTVVVVSKPTSNFITGGGYFFNQSSGGTYFGDPDLKTNFGLTIKFNKKLTNLQGRVTIIVRQGGRVYQIKSNALSSLVTVPYNPAKPRTGTAELIGKANITDVTDPLNPIALVGNATLNIMIKDNGEPGSADLISISLWSRDGELLFSSHWDGAQTILQLLEGGNLNVK